MVKQIGKAIGIKVTKSTVARGISKAIPLIGGVISGTLNFASMMPMAKRLYETLDSASFGYTEEEILADYEEIESFNEAENTDNEVQQEKKTEETKSTTPQENNVPANILDSVGQTFNNIGSGISGFFSKKEKEKTNTPTPKSAPTSESDDIFTNIEKLSKLKDIGAITQEEFDEKKKELLAKI